MSCNQTIEGPIQNQCTDLTFKYLAFKDQTIGDFLRDIAKIPNRDNLVIFSGSTVDVSIKIKG